MNKFARSTVCDPNVVEQEVPTGTTYEVLATAEISEVTCWSCEVIASDWNYRCSAFSHLKLSEVPHLLRHRVVTPEKCKGMVRSEHFTPEGRAAGMMLKFNTFNYFQMTATGSLQAYPSYLSCEGQETRHGDKLVENEVTLL